MANSLVERVGKIITRYSMGPAGSRIGVAVSGGADSVTLLHILHRLRSQFGVELAVIHVNHQLRAEESDGDEQFVRKLAEGLGYPCFTERTLLPAGNLEQEAREARRAFFARLRNELPLRYVALGHTRSDQAETVLYRFLRGSGTAGLAGMRPVTGDGLIRPFLGVTREEVRQWATSEGIQWREDSSNSDPAFVRNLLRNELLPRLTKLNPNLEGVLAGTATIAQAEEDYWALTVSTIYEEISKRTQLGLFLQIEKLAGLHPALRRRVIRQGIAEIRGDLRSIDLEHVEAIASLCDTSEGHDRAIIPGIDAIRSFGTLLLTRPGKLNEQSRYYRADLDIGQATEIPFKLGWIHLDCVANGLQNCAKFEKEESFRSEISYIDGDALRGPLYVRNWEPGDALRQPGHIGPEKIKTLFQRQKVLLWERRHWPVVVCQDKLVWARRFGASVEFAAGPETPNIIRLAYRD